MRAGRRCKHFRTAPGHRHRRNSEEDRLEMYFDAVKTANASPALALEKGLPHPLGASPGPGGVNFSLFSANATGVELLLFAAHDAAAPFQVIQLDPSVNKSFHFWHVFVCGLEAGAHYAYRVDGPFDPASGQRFNKNKVLIDP